MLYTIGRSTNLTGVWTPIIYVNSANNGVSLPVAGVAYLSNDASTITFTDTCIASQPQVFYRMRVLQQ